MSTYNGQNYLEEQVESIFAQKGVDAELMVRDDGSADDTLKKLTEWQSAGRLQLTKGENMGPPRSFFELLKAADAPYYAFSDQDDLWDDDKLCTAVRAIAGLSGPALYFCDSLLTDEHGKPKGRCIGHELKITKGNALIESFAAGCTMVFNRQLRDIVVANLPGKPVYHDRWVFLTAAFLGSVVYDPTPHIRYRQHSMNVIGASTEKEKGKSLSRIQAQARYPANVAAGGGGKKKNTQTTPPPTRYPANVAAGELINKYSTKLSPADTTLIRRCRDYRTKLTSRMWLALAPEYRLAYGGVARRAYWTLRILLKKI